MAIPIVDAMENDVGGGERELAVGDGVKEVVWQKPRLDR